MNHISFNLIGIFVNDLRAMVDFYHQVIGVEIEWDGEGPYAEFKHKGIRFAMYERRMLPDLLGLQPSFPQGVNGSFELAVNVGDSHKVDKFFSKAVSAGAQPIYFPRNEPWKMRSAMIADPEGNLIEIASDFWE
ncbi:MAG: VOC family protein [Bacteroidales bacterium]|nr:VOC family protein [Bacteroidales bacterium]HOY38330.1 VOC family protein [Bacteroidales bacterium]HQP03425.1 VOC family protein [Bacteroidales bacterium]